MLKQQERRRGRSFLGSVEALDKIRLLSASAIIEPLTQPGAFTINGTNPAIVPAGLRLTNGLEQDASVWFKDPLTSSHYTASFDFSLSNPGGIGWADGLTFAVVDSTKNGPHALGGAGGGIGYSGLTGYAIEFDTFYNPTNGDPDYPHIGLDLGGSMDSVALSGKLPFDIRNAGDVTATITYDSGRIAVSIAKSGGTPVQVLESSVPAKDVPAVGQVGITAATWAGSEKAVVSNFNLDSAYTPAQIKSAYGIDAIPPSKGVNLDGTGQTIAIIGEGSDPNITQDVAAFDKQFGIAPISLTITNELGDASPLPPVATSNLNWPLEEAMDVEWAHALAPGAKIDLVECNGGITDSLKDYLQGALTAATKLGASVVSMSAYGPETATETNPYGDNYFANHAGVTFLAATGDTGAPAAYPAASPYVVAVGGTTLALTDKNAYKKETGWNKSGGGASKYETTEPSYQLGVQKTGKRTIPDIAFDADSASGVVIYDSYDATSSISPWALGDGTSLGTPSWAALIAIADEGRVLAGGQPLTGQTQTLPALYDIAQANYHNNLGGDNGTGAAGSRYSLVTGLGSPVASSLVPALASWQPVALVGTVPTGTVGTAYSASITAVANTGTAGNKVLTYAITSGTLPAGLKIATKANELDITGTPTAAGTLKFNVTGTDINGFSVTNSVVVTINPKSSK